MTGFAKPLPMPIFGECFKAFEFCLPTNATNFPAGPEWLHEIKHDGFCLRVERDGESGAADHAWRLRLDEALSLDRRVRSEEPHQAIRDRWRGGCSGRASFSHEFQNTNFPTSKAKTLTHATVTLMNVTDSITPTARSRPLSSGQSNQRFIAAPLNQVDR